MDNQIKKILKDYILGGSSFKKEALELLVEGTITTHFRFDETRLIKDWIEQSYSNYKDFQSSIIALNENGSSIPLIKLIRLATGMSLKEAKDLHDSQEFRNEVKTLLK